MTENTKFYEVTVMENGEVVRHGDCKSMDSKAFWESIFTTIAIEWMADGFKGIFVTNEGEYVEVVVNENDPVY